MNGLGWNLLAHLADASVRAVFLAGAAALALLFPGARRAAVQHALWAAVIAGMLVLPFTPALPKSAAARLPAAYPFASAPEPVQVKPAPGPAAPTPAPALPWLALAASAYTVVALLFLVRLLLACGSLRRVRHASRVIEEPGALAACEEVSVRYGLAWPLPQLRESDAVRVPLTARAREVILPAAWRSWDDWTLRAVLAHELAHLVRRDWLVLLLAAVNKCVFWFHPLAWWLERRVALLAEHAADDCSLAASRDCPRYAELLLRFAQAARGGRVALFGSAMARPGLRARIGRVLARERIPSGFATRAVWLATAACLVPVFYAVAPSRAQNVPLVEPPRGLEAMTSALALTPLQVQKLEEELRSNPEDVSARSNLIAYYFLNSMRQPRLDHIFWLIENHPESPAHSQYQVRMSPAESPLNTTADYERAQALWLEQARKHAGDPQVLANAAWFVIERDLAAAEDLLEQARARDPNNPARTEQLAGLYVRALAASRAAAPWPAIGGLPGAIVTRSPVPQADPAFAAAARAKLQSSPDAALVGSVGAALARFGRQSQVSSDPQMNARIEEAARLNREEGRRLLERAAQLEPANPRWPALLQEADKPFAAPPASPPTSSQPPDRIRVGANVQASMLVESPPPDYPPLARQARIQGIVRVEIVVNKQGAIANMRVISGHPLLVPAAMEAVKQWRYRPTFLNGAPVEVISAVDVPFTLNAGR